jgi:hypothetical protein
MEVEIESNIQITPKTILSFVILPILTNLSILLFEIFSIDIWVSNSDPSNIIGVVGVFFYYIGCLLLFLAYGYSTGGWGLFLGLESRILVFCLILTYPIFYLFWLPFVIYQLLLTIGTPRAIWERMFMGTALSTELFHPDFNFSGCERAVRFIYIGIPFVLFSLIIICLLVLLSPLWYFILSPLGFGTFGICLHLALHFPHSMEMDIIERIGLAYKWGVFVHVWTLALPFALIAILHLVIVGITWFGCLLAITTLMQFLIDVVPSTINVLNRNG